MAFSWLAGPRMSLDQSYNASPLNCTDKLMEARCWKELVRAVISHLSQG